MKLAKIKIRPKHAARIEPAQSHPDQVELSSDAKTVWVHAMDGSTVGRFSKVFGMDVHTTITAQMQGANQCLHCTHEKPIQADWLHFCELMQTHYGIQVDPSLIDLCLRSGGLTRPATASPNSLPCAWLLAEKCRGLVSR